MHQICFGLDENTKNFSKDTGQSDWSQVRLRGEESNNHCMCLGAWSLYKAKQNLAKTDSKNIKRTSNELKCKAIPDTAFMSDYVNKWNTWNGNELPNQIVDGMEEMVNQCLDDAENEEEKDYLLEKYCKLAEDNTNLQNSFSHNLYCKKLIDLSNLNPKEYLNTKPKKIAAKYEEKIFTPMCLNPADAIEDSKSETVHLAVPGLMPASPDYWKNYHNRHQIFYMPNDKKPHLHGDAPHHQAKFDIDKVWLMSKNKYVKTSSKQIRNIEINQVLLALIRVKLILQ